MNYFMDLEVYKNFFLCSFMREDGKIKHIEKHADKALDIKSIIKILGRTGNTIITFNGNHYDMPVLKLALSGGTCAEMKSLSDKIIVEQIKTWNLDRPKCDHVDLKEVAPSMASLKIYGGRMAAQKLKDLPIDPSHLVTASQREELKTYCENDLRLTELLYKSLIPQLDLRVKLTNEYNVDMRSKSDAQIAEAIIRKYLKTKKVIANKRESSVEPFKYKVPTWVQFESVEFNGMLEKVKACTFEVNEKGSVLMPHELDKAVEYCGGKYKFGIGGLHSQEKKQAIKANNNQIFGEFDVASMYPSIIIEQNLYPLHLGPKFLDVYSDIKEERLLAKRGGDTVKNQTYKIVLNGSYGKFGSKYSFLYSPELLIQTTITGQLSLLMLIEKMTMAGGAVYSANTDGVNVLFDKSIEADIFSVQFDWELTTGYELEFTEYKAVYSRDVNNYIAIKNDGVKGKGAFAIGGLMKNPSNNICIEAVINYLVNDNDIESFIENSEDITKFLTVKTVSGGAVFRGEEVGKAIRFYHSTDGDTINYKKNGNKVPTSDGCKPLMDLPVEFPCDVDKNWYINEAVKILNLIGVDYA